MSFDAHANFGYTTVTAAPAPAASGTSITVSDASVFPAAPFNATVWATGEIPVASNAEIVRVTAVVGNVLTITRAQESSVARSILVGDQIANTITVKVVTDIEAAIPSTAGLLSAVNVSAGATSANLSALTFSNSNGVSFGLTNGIITGTVATNYQSQGAYLTTAALSQDSSKYAGTNGAITGGSITVNTSGVSINLPAYLTTAMQSNAVTLSNAKFSAGTLSALRSDLTFGDSNGISFGLNTNGVLTATVATNYQSAGAYLTTAALSQDSSKYAGTNGAITGGSITVNTSGVSVNLPAYLSTQSTQYLAMTLGGNTAGTTTFNASDNATIFLHGGNNITLSGNGASITISGPNAGGAQTGISGIVVSDTTYTSGTVSFSNAGNITIASSVNGATQYIKLSGNAAQTTQSAIKAFGVSNTGQTAGNTGVSTGIDWVIAGSNSITLSQSTAGGGPNTVWIQHPAWLTTAMQSNAATISNIKISAGAASANLSAVTFSDSNGLAFGLNGSTITGSYTVPTVTNSSLSVSDAATSGTLARLAFTNLNGVTLSLSTGAGGSHTIVGSHNAITSQSTQFIALTLGGNTAGTTTFHATNNASLFLNGGNNITLSGNGSTVTISAAAQTNQSAIKGFGVSNTGQTAGNTGISTGIDWVLAGSDSITLSQSTAGGGPNTVWFKHPAWLTTAALSGDTSKYVQAWELTGNTAGTTSSAQGTKLYFSGGNSITVSGSNNTIVFSVGNYLTTAMASNRGSDFVQATAGFNGTNASGTIASNSWSVSVAAPIPIATAVKAVASIGSTGTITRYAPEDHQHAGVAAFAVTNTGNTLGNTRSQVGTFYIAASGAITASQSTAAAGNDTVWLSVASQTNQTMSWYAVGNTTGQSSNTSFDARTVSFNGAGNVSVGYSAGSLVISGGTAAPSPVNFSAGTTSGNLGSVVFSNSNGVSFGLNGSTVTATVSTYDTVGTATTVYSVASANSVGTVTRWAAEDHRHAGVGGFGISTSGNTSGTTGSNVGTVWLQGGNSITLSQITSNNGSHTIVVSGAKDGFNGWLEPYPLNTATATLLPAAGSWYLAPFTAYGSVSGGRVNFLAVNTGTANLFQDLGETAYKSNTTGTLSQVFTLSAAMAIFSQGTGANSTRLESVWSNSHSFGWSKVLNVSTNAATNIAVSLAHSLSYQSEIGSDGAYTNVQYANAGSSTFGNSSGASTGLSTVFSSGRNIISGSLVQPFGFSTTLTAGVYWMGYAWSSTRGTTTTGGQLGSAPDFGFSGLLGLSRLAVDSLFRNFGSTVTTARSQLIPYGVYTAAANMAPPSAIALSSDLSSLASQWVPYFAFNNRGLTK